MKSEDANRRFEEILSWRLATELWRRFPEQFHLIETHAGGGMYDSLSLVSRDPHPRMILSINRPGSLHIHSPAEGREGRWSDWGERMLDRSAREFLDELTRSLGLQVPKILPPSTPTTLTYRFVAEFLTHSIGQQEFWQCRNGMLDTSDYGGGRKSDWFDQFPQVPIAENPPRTQAILGEPAYHYWFLTKNGTPKLCLGIDGQAYTEHGRVYDLAEHYSPARSIWPLILTIAPHLLP